MVPEIAEILQRCEQLRLSQSELARRADMHATTLNKLAKGKSRNPHRRTIAKLRDALRQFEAEALQ